MLLYFLTGNLSAITLWPLATLVHCPGNLYSTPGFALLSNLSLPNARNVLVTMKHFYGRADVITFLFVPHLLGHSLQENELYNTKDRMDVLQSTWGQFALTGLGWCFQLAIQDELPASFNNYVFLLFSTHVNYVLALRSWWSLVVCQAYPWLALRPKIAHQEILVSHIQGSMHGITIHHVNTLESLKSFIDLSEQLRQKYIGQAVLHAARGLELPTGIVWSH